MNRVNTVSVKTKSYLSVTLAVLERSNMHTDKANLTNIIRIFSKISRSIKSKHPQEKW